MTLIRLPDHRGEKIWLWI